MNQTKIETFNFDDRDNIGTKVDKIKYSSISENIEPLSILLFRGDTWYSHLIEWIQAEEVAPFYLEEYGLYSHCAIIVNKQLFPKVKQMENGKLYIFEMTSTGGIFSKDSPDIETGKGKTGLQIRELESVLKTYQGRIVLLKLKNNPLKQMEDESIKDFQMRIQELCLKSQDYKDKNIDDSYQLNPLRLFASVFSDIRWVRSFSIGKNWKMCGHVLSEYLQTLGILDSNLNPEDVIPEDFIYDADKKIPKDLYLLPPIEVIYDLD